MAEFRMPSLGADMEAGTLVEWLKRPGDVVHKGDVIGVVETQKGAIEIEVFDEGVIEKLLLEPSATVPVGTPMALIRGAATEAAPAPPVTPAAPVPPGAAPAVPMPASRGVVASPAARRLAVQRGIDIAGLHGSGPGGAIVSADVERALRVPPAPTAPRRLDLAEMRRAIGAAMARSKREIPHFYLATTIDLGTTLAWLAHANTERPPQRRLLLAALLLKATALALREVPELNGFYTGEGFVPAAEIHLGVAIALRGGGLVAPAIHRCNELAIEALMLQLRDLTARARSGALRSSELADATITVTSLGERGVEAVTGVIYPPQVALVGFGTPVERARVVAGEVAPRPVITATLAADHRATDGHRAALLLASIDRRLQSPEEL